MNALSKRILEASDMEINDIISAAQERYSQLFPDWEITMISIDKTEDRNTQIDRLIQVLETLRNL